MNTAPPGTGRRSQSRRDVVRTGVVLGAGAVARALVGPTAASARRSQARPAVRAIYMNPLISTTAADFVDLVDLIAATELNALVVDVKEEWVYVDSAVPLYRDAGAVDPILDLPGLLNTLAENDVYAIARLVVFKDNLIAAARPDLAVLDRTTGAPWLDDGGQAWLNPFNPEVWDGVVGFAEELALAGFDEIQFDYVRFPSDGDLSLLDYGQEVDEAAKIEVITEFLGVARERLAPTGVATAADVFGYTLLLDDIGIGQNVQRLADVVDTICPMVYPSHFPEGSVDVPGHPNDFPGETIAISMAVGADRIAPSRLRPWLQDFTLPGMTAYGAAEVRAQIDAADAAGTDGWMIWDPDNVYSRDAFLPAP